MVFLNQFNVFSLLGFELFNVVGKKGLGDSVFLRLCCKISRFRISRQDTDLLVSELVKLDVEILVLHEKIFVGL